MDMIKPHKISEIMMANDVISKAIVFMRMVVLNLININNIIKVDLLTNKMTRKCPVHLKQLIRVIQFYQTTWEAIKAQASRTIKWEAIKANRTPEKTVSIKASKYSQALALRVYVRIILA